MTGTPEQRVEVLRSHLGYPVKQLDPGGSRFWYLRPGENENEAEYTCPIAVGFYSELNRADRSEGLEFLTSEAQQQEIYGHYINRVIPEQPVMYLLLPEGEQQGLVAMILPTETKLRQRQIQTFAWNAEDLQARLQRLRQDTLARTDRIRETTLSVVPLVEWAFYKPIKTARELAQQLAVVSRTIEQAIPAVYNAEGNGGYLHNLLQSFQRELLPTLKLEAETAKDYSFADIYAQTIAYGLFTARVFSYTVDERRRQEENDPERKERDFNRQNAWDLLPETNPFLRRLFRDVSQQPIEVLGDELGDAISEVFSILRAAKMEAILEDFRSKMNREDIVIRFYEDFLAAYKPEMRERRGVYYTPEPVVSYMVRSVDILLKEKFDKPLGLADPEVMILDPACGTGTFLLWIFQLIHQRFEENPEALTEGLEEKTWSGYVKERLLPRIFGFELLMAPYAICHLKLGLFLEETGYEFDSGKRLGVYLTNTLDEELQKSESLFEEFIAEESDQAAEIKRYKPVMVVVGNPPYSVSSANKEKDIEDLMASYKKAVIDEYNRQPLSDDYIKFIRFSHNRIERTGFGIVAMITSSSYLSGLIHRGMREELRKSFEEIYLLDLHGSALMEEKPLNCVDENFFDIRQGVSINFFIKSQVLEKANVKYSQLWGRREEKRLCLEQNNITTIDYSNIDLTFPYFFFVPKDFDFLAEYSSFPKITEVFGTYQRGIATRRDHFMVDQSREELKGRLSILTSDDLSDEQISAKFNIRSTAYWDLESSRRTVRNLERAENEIRKYSYRPFDIRQIIYIPDLIERGDAAFQTMRHMLYPNMAILCFRRIRDKAPYQFFVAQGLVDKTFLSSKDNATVFPLYVYQDLDSPQKVLLEDLVISNIRKGFLSYVREKLGKLPDCKSIFFYIYATLSSPTYRTRYTEFLKIDFPRVPVTSNHKIFNQLITYGEELVNLHLMKSEKLATLITRFEQISDRTVAPGHPKYANGKVTINKQGDGFTGVPEEVWNFYVGGYQVCHKWLKDRKGRTLSDDDILHYQRIVVALKETITLMQKIDEAIPSWPIE